jgi:hypothetical protein
MNDKEESIFVLCNLMHVQYKKPLRWSKLVDRFGELVLIAEYKEKDYLQITEEDAEKYGFWSREITSSNCFSDEVYKPRVMRKIGIFEFIADTWVARTERNVAAIIGDIARHEGKDPIQLFDSLV